MSGDFKLLLPKPQEVIPSTQTKVTHLLCAYVHTYNERITLLFNSLTYNLWLFKKMVHKLRSWQWQKTVDEILIAN